MIKKYYSYLIIVILMISYFIVGGISMDKGVGKLYYSNSLQEAENEETIINKYIVLDMNGKQVSHAWLEYARSYNIFNKKRIEKNKILLNIANIGEFEKLKKKNWIAFYKNKNLTIFVNKKIISIVEADKKDTIFIQNNINKYIIVKK